MTVARLILAGACAVGAVGCAKKKPARTDGPAAPELTAEAPPAVPAPAGAAAGGWTASTPLGVVTQPTAVKEGAAPLVYLVETEATIRVRDETAKRDLAQSVVAGRRIVRVDARTGVVYGGDTVVPGPLPADHRYVIFVERAGENVSRQGTFQLTPREAR